jgi:hypothetical protein
MPHLSPVPNRCCIQVEPRPFPTLIGQSTTSLTDLYGIQGDLCGPLSCVQDHAGTVLPRGAPCVRLRCHPVHIRPAGLTGGVHVRKLALDQLQQVDKTGAWALGHTTRQGSEE